MGTKERRDREKMERRAAILRTARRLFSKVGYEETTMPDIARAMELAPGTLYRYFAGKNALYAEILVEGYDVLIERLREAAGRDAGPRELAEGMIDAFLGFASDCPEYFDIIFFLLQRDGRAARHAALESGQVAHLVAKEEECKRIVGSVLERVEGATRMGAESPESRARVDAVWSMLAGVVFFFRTEGAESLGAVTSEAKRLILRALFAPGSVSAETGGPPADAGCVAGG